MLVVGIVYKQFPYIINSNDSKSFSSVSFKGKSNKNKVFLNEKFQITYTLTENGDRFKGPDFSDFTVIDGPKTSSSTRIISGKVKKENTYTYYLKANKIGSYDIGAASIRIRGNTFKYSNEINIIVSNSSKSSYRPKSGYSPYNSYYGKGIYNKGTDNSVQVTAPISSDIVFLVKNIRTGRTIRNEYIRGNTQFVLTDLPYGKYKFYYLYGKDWSPDADFKGGVAKGNFLTNKGVSKSEDTFDFDFQDGYYGTYEITLQLLSNGNLKTERSSENEL